MGWKRDYVLAVKDLKLKVAGEQLALPPSSTKDLLDLLDKTKQDLTCVDQEPSFSMRAALVPLKGALIRDELLKHSDVDVRVSVASCLCEVVRIAAPEPPYKDEIMKDIFQLNVMAFGELSNVSGGSYHKAIHILDSVARVKSCLLMLDLHCDDLILEMFEQFLSRIRTSHPQIVFSGMESIMTLVIKESDEVASGILSLLISHVRKENLNVLPAPWKLAEKVLRNCYDTLKPYYKKLMEFIEGDPDGYAEVVTTLCQNNELVGSKEELRKTRFQDKSLKEKSKGMKGSSGKHEKEMTKTKGNLGISDSLYEKEDKKDVHDGSQSKGLKYGKQLVGHRIKVWWPLDQKYYEGTVSAYNALDNKHKVEYADGDEEVLDLRLEKWCILDDEQEEQAADLPSPMTTLSSKREKQKGKGKVEEKPTKEDDIKTLGFSFEVKFSEKTISKRGLKITIEIGG